MRKILSSFVIWTHADDRPTIGDMRRGLVAFLIAGWLSLPAQAAEAYREIPFDFLHNQIVLRGTVDGHGPYSFILDTGTHGATIDIGLARELDLPIHLHGISEGVGEGRSLRSHTTFVQLRLGEMVVNHLEAAVLDLSGISRTLGRPLHGVLGFGFLGSSVTQIDYFQRRIRFFAESPTPSKEPEDSQKVISFPMQFRSKSVLPVLEECYVNGMRMAVTLDTGSSLGLVLFPRAVEWLGLGELARTGLPIEAAGYVGDARLTKGWVKSVVLNTIDLGAVEVAYAGRGFSNDEDPNRRGGSVGNAILQDFVLTLDYRARRVTLQRVAE